MFRYWPTATQDVVDTQETEKRKESGKTGPASVAASDGSGASAVFQLPPDRVSTTGKAYPAVSRYSPTATQDVAVGQETAWQG